MNESPQDRLEWLLSERLDRALTADEAAELVRALAEDPAGPRRVLDFQQLDVALRAWRGTLPEVDWQAIKSRILSGVDDLTELAISEELDRRIDRNALVGEPGPVTAAKGEVREAFERTERTIRAVGASLPPVNWDALRMRISTRVAQEAALSAAKTAGRLKARNWARLVNVAAPLAAAAAVAIAVLWGTRPPSIPIGGGDKPAAMVVVALDIPTYSGRVKVFFDPDQRQEPPTIDTTMQSATEASGGMVIAVAAPADWDMDSPEDAFYH